MSSHQNGKMVQTDQRQNPIEGQRDEPKSLLGLFTQAGETHRQLYPWKTPNMVCQMHR